MDYLSKCLSATEFVSIMLSADFIVHIILNILIFVSNKRFSEGLKGIYGKTFSHHSVITLTECTKNPRGNNFLKFRSNVLRLICHIYWGILSLSGVKYKGFSV